MSIPTANDVAQEIASLLRSGGRHVVTIKWPRFYELSRRDATMIAFMIDYDFAPLVRMEEGTVNSA